MSDNDFTLAELHMIKDSLKLGTLHTKLNKMIACFKCKEVTNNGQLIKRFMKLAMING